MSSDQKSYGVVAGFFLIIAALYGLQHVMPSYIGTGYIGLYLLMAGLSLYVWQRQVLSPQYCLYLGIALCLALFPLSPLTSNDAERYLWDGAVFLNGLDPYITAPNDAAVSALRDIWPTPPEHAAYPTLYPPGALSLFALSAMTGPVFGFWLWKLTISIAAIASLVLTYDPVSYTHLTLPTIYSV